MHTATEAGRPWSMVLAQIEQNRIAQQAALSRYGSGSVDRYLSYIFYVVTGRSQGVAMDFGALNRIAERLVEAERAHEILRALGYGKAWDSIAELAQMVPHSTTMLIRQRK